MSAIKKILSIFILAFCILMYWIPVYAETFKIQDVELIEADIIDVQFTRELDTSLTAIREFILEEESSALEIEILLSEVVQNDTTKVTLMLDQFLKENTNYTITVLDIKDFDGNTIEAWIDSVFTFNTGIMTIANPSEPMIQVPDENLPEEDSSLVSEELEFPDDSLDDELMGIDLNAWAEVSWIDVSGMAWTTTHSQDITPGVMIHAEQNTDLPETGPEIILLLLLSLLAAWMFLYSKHPRV